MRKRTHILTDEQNADIRSIVKVWRNGAIVGSGSARGPLLASPMGSGKTGMAVAAADMAGFKRVLLIAPKSSIPDWKRDIGGFHRTPNIPIQILRPGSLWTHVRAGWFIINYEKIEKYEELKNTPWDLLIIDEAQYLKEPTTKRWKTVFGGEYKKVSIRPITFRNLLVVSGTPMKDRVEEMFNLLHLADPERWPDREAFIRRYYALGVEITADGKAVQNVPNIDLDKLHGLLRRTVLVRTKPKLGERAFQLLLLDSSHMDADDAYRLMEIGESLVKIGRMLKQDRDNSDLKAIQDGLTAERFRMVARIKYPLIRNYLLAQRHKVVVICSHLDFIEGLKTVLQDAGKGVVSHTGQDGSPEQAVKQFQTDPEIQFFIGQVLAAGVSLTLTAASHLLIAELPPTSADLDQAAARVHRYGQEEAVTTAVAILDDNLSGEPERLQYLEKRRMIRAQVLDGESGGSAGFNWSEIINIAL